MEFLNTKNILRVLPLLVGFLCVPLVYSYKFADPFYNTKHFIVLVVVVWACCYLTLNFVSLKIPHLYIWEFALFIGGLLSMCINWFRLNPETWIEPAVERAAFLGLVIFAFSLTKVVGNKWMIACAAALVTAMLMTAAFLLGERWGVNLWPKIYNPVNGFMATSNNQAQVLALTLPFLFYLWYSIPMRLAKFFIAGCVLLSLWCFYFLGSRSAALSIVLLLAAFILRAVFLKVPKVWYGAAIVLIVVLSGCFTGGNNHPTTFAPAHKSESIQRRVKLWTIALRMLKDNPLGVGSKNFVFAMMPYRIKADLQSEETVSQKSPHSEFLRFLVEEGSVTCFLLAGFFLLLMIRIFHRGNGLENSEKIFFASLLLVLGIEMLFQFPFENAFPFMVFAVVLGYMLGQTTESYRFASDGAIAFSICLICTIFFAQGTYRVIYSNYLYKRNVKTFPDQAELDESCDLNPSFWQACLFAGINDIRSDRLKDGQAKLHKVIQRQPFNIYALRFLGASYLNQENYPAGCAAMFIYDRIFADKSTLHQFLEYPGCGFVKEIKTQLPPPFKKYEVAALSK